MIRGRLRGAPAGATVGALTRVFNTMVTRLREGRQELEERSITDQLTGLYNRRHLEHALATGTIS